MKNFNEWIENIGIQISWFVGGLAGGFVSQRKKGYSFWEKVAAVLSGGLIANYLTPLFASIISVSEEGLYGMAFIIGFMGMSAVELVINYFHNKLER